MIRIDHLLKWVELSPFELLTPILIEMNDIRNFTYDNVKRLC